MKKSSLLKLVSEFLLEAFGSLEIWFEIAAAPLRLAYHYFLFFLTLSLRFALLHEVIYILNFLFPSCESSLGDEHYKCLQFILISVEMER